MLKGTTGSGFEFEIDSEELTNMEFLDLLAEANEGSALAFSRAVDWMFGKEQKKRLYDHLRDENGKVPIEAVNAIVEEIMSYEEDTKNS